jgi:hypothetical protein
MSTTPYDRGLCGEPGRRLGWTCGRPAGHQPPCMYPGGPPGDDGGPIILAWEPDPVLALEAAAALVALLPGVTGTEVRP